MSEDPRTTSPLPSPSDTNWNSSFATSASPPHPTAKTNDLGHARSVFREQFAIEVSYKEGELELIEERIHLAKILLQRLRLGVLAQHYGAAAFCPTTLDYREETVGAQDTWEVFEKEIVDKRDEGQEVVDKQRKDTKDREEANDSDGGGSRVTAEGKEDGVMLPPPLLIKDEGEKEGEEEEGEEKDGVVRGVADLDGSEGGSSDEELNMDDDIAMEGSLPPLPMNKEPLPALAPSEEELQRQVDEDEEEQESRFYHKKRVIVGNTSQYLDPVAHQYTSADGSTHKWMVYVRGPQAEPDISHFVKAVRFFLHPSYHPNDIVRVRSPPFHLTRHGWGEFPVRVQLEFGDKSNKPVDILHNLVLDRTHTGQQTLGAETVVDLDIVAPPGQQSLHLNGFSSNPVRNIKEGRSLVSVTGPQQPPPCLSSTSSSSLSSSRASTGLDSLQSRSDQSVPMDQPLEHSSSAHPPPSPQLSESVCGSVSGESGAAGVSTGVGSVITTNLDKCLHTAVRAIPICGKPLPSEEFYIPAPSLAQFRIWNIGRRRATEWMRAVAVKKSIQRKLHVPSLLSTRRVMQWCRQNGYTPLDSAPEGGRGFCKICGCQLQAEMGGDEMEDEEEEEEEGYDDNSELGRRRKNLEVHEHCHSMLFGPGSYLREGLLDIYEDLQTADYSTEIDNSLPSRPKLSLLGQPHELMERVFSLQQQLESEEKGTEEDVDTMSLPPSPSCARSRALVDIVPRFRVPQTPELKWIQQTASSVGIRIFPAVIDRMYAHVVEHMMYISCARFLRGILGQAIQGAWQGEEGSLSQDRILTPFHLQQAILRLEHCDFLTNRYLGVQGGPLGGVGGSGGSSHTSTTGSSCSRDASSDEEGL